MAGSGSFFPANGTVIIPWYTTGFRSDGFAAALNEVAAVALRYGATSYAVYRSRDDRYKLQQLAAFETALEWERYWEGPEMIDFRTRHSSWHQVPILYGWWDITASGGLDQHRSNGAIVSPAPLS
ncbi:MAG TPA: hypothetical protein VGY76_06995 [Solirubrobacteraceae bacterium]|jgi:hypothetical protein|nr:hypothetical protein [Solirubrobacteraceae bacterium]